MEVLKKKIRTVVLALVISLMFQMNAFAAISVNSNHLGAYYLSGYQRISVYSDLIVCRAYPTDWGYITGFCDSGMLSISANGFFAESYDAYYVDEYDHKINNNTFYYFFEGDVTADHGLFGILKAIHITTTFGDTFTKEV